MSPLERIAGLHHHDGDEPCPYCVVCDREWPCATWVVATQTLEVYETWAVLQKGLDSAAALDQAQALARIPD